MVAPWLEDWRKYIIPVIILAPIVAVVVSVYLIPKPTKPTSPFIPFEVAGTSAVEKMPDLAYNSKTKELLVAYLQEQSSLPGKPFELRVKRFSAEGKQQGKEVQPFGTHVAIGRPAVAYSSKSNMFFVAIAEEATATTDRVLGRFMDASGSPLSSQQILFKNIIDSIYEGPVEPRPGGLHVTYNSLLDEFLVTVQGNVGGKGGIWGQRISYSKGIIDTIQLADLGTWGMSQSHAVAYAPVPNTNPPGGRYLFSVGSSAELLNSEAKRITYVPLYHGFPEGETLDPDIAFGEIEGKERFLLVYSDEDNCNPVPHQPCPNMVDQWTGVWGTYIDPGQVTYTGKAGNTPFPISKIYVHVGNRYVYKPRVAHSIDTKAFFVAWREYPFDNIKNDESRSHIRGNKIDYFVQDGLYGLSVPLPYDNVVISEVTGTCPNPGKLCASKEDPDFADVVAVGKDQACVVWHQKDPLNPSDLNILGKIFCLNVVG